jgi:nucleotidyltransferase/DNA polymerase involved in DNA repair
MTMKQDDLTQLRHVGIARMKVLNDLGITTIEQLYEMPVEKLAQIQSIGERYAKLIKDAVTEVYESSAEKIAEETESTKEKIIAKIDQDLQQRLKILNKRFKQTNEKLKPLGKKKNLPLYIDVKNRSKTLKARLKALEQLEGDLPKKVKKKIIKKADALTTTMKKVGKKPKKKTYTALSQEIQLFTKMLRETSSG